jgi:hypothetical protein
MEYIYFHIYTSKWNISVYHIFQLNDTNFTKPRTFQYRMHNSTSNIHFHPSSNVQYQLWAIISPEITFKDTLDNSNNGISTLQVMHKNSNKVIHYRFFFKTIKFHWCLPPAGSDDRILSITKENDDRIVFCFFSSNKWHDKNECARCSPILGTRNMWKTWSMGFRQDLTR